jgi:hypothetical protein
MHEPLFLQLINTGKESADVSLLFTWANSVGGTSASTGGHYNEPYVLVTYPYAKSCKVFSS